jgi:nucleoside triphosphate pyrophosphatase
VSGRTELVLASASPARLKTLRHAGIEPTVLVADVDEPAVVDEYAARLGAPLSAEEVALLLARTKAEVVAGRVDDGLVLGCDSVLELDGEVHGKPSGPDEATERWRRMRGSEGVLHTGHWLVDARDSAGSGATIGGVASTLVRFADVSEEEIAAYVATGEPLRVAGAFTIDGLGGAFVEGVDGDPHAVVGLSLPLVRRLLADVGVPWTSLWADFGNGSDRLFD